MNQDGTGAARSLKAKHSAAVMFDYLGDLKDDFLLHSKQKNTFHVDSNSHNTAFKTKQPQNPIDCTHDGNPSKLEAACWHFSQEKKKKSAHRPFILFTRSANLWGLSTQPEASTGWALQCTNTTARGVCFPGWLRSHDEISEQHGCL